MASGKSLYLKNRLLDHVLGGGDYLRPNTVFIGLYTKEPDERGHGTEVNADGYERVAVPNGPDHFPPAVNGSKTNGMRIVYPESIESWGNVVAVGVHDGDGQMLFWGRLKEARLVRAATIVDFQPGSITFLET